MNSFKNSTKIRAEKYADYVWVWSANLPTFISLFSDEGSQTSSTHSAAWILFSQRISKHTHPGERMHSCNTVTLLYTGQKQKKKRLTYFVLCFRLTGRGDIWLLVKKSPTDLASALTHFFPITTQPIHCRCVSTITISSTKIIKVIV